jgi:hypothetical protein
MARSAYIYLVYKLGKLVAAFTVKHEMYSFVEREMKKGKHGFTYVPMRDGGDC